MDRQRNRSRDMIHVRNVDDIDIKFKASPQNTARYVIENIAQKNPELTPKELIQLGKGHYINIKNPETTIGKTHVKNGKVKQKTGGN